MNLLLLVPMLLLSGLCATLLAFVSRRFWVGLLGGPLGVFLFGVLVTQLEWLDWLKLNTTPLDAGVRYLGAFWEVGAIAGVVGAALGWLARRLRAARRSSALLAKQAKTSAQDPRA